MSLTFIDNGRKIRDSLGAVIEKGFIPGDAVSISLPRWVSVRAVRPGVGVCDDVH